MDRWEAKAMRYEKERKEAAGNPYMDFTRMRRESVGAMIDKILERVKPINGTTIKFNPGPCEFSFQVKDGEWYFSINGSEHEFAKNGHDVAQRIYRYGKSRGVNL